MAFFSEIMTSKGTPFAVFDVVNRNAIDPIFVFNDNSEHIGHLAIMLAEIWCGRQSYRSL